MSTLFACKVTIKILHCIEKDMAFEIHLKYNNSSHGNIIHLTPYHRYSRKYLCPYKNIKKFINTSFYCGQRKYTDMHLVQIDELILVIL